MCGICGLVHDDPRRPVDPARLAAMNDAMAHRGPDDSGLWSGGNVGLAMRRLSIIDLFSGHQPMMSDDGRVVVVFNGEIYNFQEIRSELETMGYDFHSLSDTEVVLHAYEAYGDDALTRFNGMFAVAIHDARKDRLLLARDRLGIKPLFYTRHNGALAFASELDSLFHSGLVQGRLNPAAIDAFFSFLYIPAPDTIFDGVHKLLPGEKLVCERGQVRTERYWTPEFAPDTSWTLDSAAEAFTELLESAVRLQRVSDVPLGAFLSGGLDSSAVVGMLSDMGASPVQTFTVCFDDAHADELEYARIAARHFGTEHHEEILKPDMADTAASLIRHFGEPFADSSAVPTWLVSRMARKHVTVALSGDGGDELFAGYTWLHMARNVNQYRIVPAPLRALVDVLLAIAPRNPYVEKIRRFSRDSFLAPHDVFRRRETCFQSAMRAAIYKPALRELVEKCAVDRFQEHADTAKRFSTDDAMLHHDLSMYLPDDILTKVDRMSMANSLEARVPLLDHRLVEFAATVPFDLKLKGHTSKRLVKHALSTFLPPELLVQRKQGFAIPIQRWFRRELKAHFQDTVLSQDALCRDYLDATAMDSIFQSHTTGKEDYGHHLWTLLMFEHWLRYTQSLPNITPTL